MIPDLDTWLLVTIKAVFALMMVGAVMTMAGYSVLAERKVSAWMQGRVGPNRTVLPFVGYIPVLGPFLKGLGIFQPLADGFVRSVQVVMFRGSRSVQDTCWEEVYVAVGEL